MQSSFTDSLVTFIRALVCSAFVFGSIWGPSVHLAKPWWAVQINRKVISRHVLHITRLTGKQPIRKAELHYWTWHSHSREDAQEIHHIIVSTCWWISQNCRVFQNALTIELFTTGHKLIATLNLHIKPRRSSWFNPTACHLEKLKGMLWPHEYVMTT